jgi:hypothetical protein
MNRLLAAVALALLALSGCKEEDPPAPWCGHFWTSNGYAGQGDVLEVVRLSQWTPDGFICDTPDGGYLVELYKLTGSEPRDVRLVGVEPCPYTSGRVRVDGNCLCMSDRGQDGGVTLVRDGD